MIKKSSNFFEEHAEKIVLILTLLLCFWVLMTRVFLSPNKVLYDKKKLSMEEIDNYIIKDIKLLELKLDDKAEAGAVYKPKRDGFIAVIESAIGDIDSDVYLPQPVPGKEVVERKLYHLPKIGQTDAVAVEHIRAVAYLPVGLIDEENTDSTVKYEPNDLDLVTVEAKFDIVGLYERFNESFAGDDLKEEWRDSSFAKPVFAAVQLQRQEQLADGNWGDWHDVHRIKIDRYRELFEIIERVEDLPAGGIKIRQLHFDNNLLQRELLQPKAYFIASSDEQWFPPLLHKELVDKVEKKKAQKIHEMKAEEKELRDKERREARGKRVTETTTVPGTTGGGGGGGGDRFGGGGGSTAVTPTPRRSPIEKPESITVPAVSEEEIFSEVEREIYSDFEKVLITKPTSFSDMNKPFTFWAHDDTVEPEKSYRYRIRMGVFNPVAGTDDISEGDKSKQRDVILWSDFSKTTEEVMIPGNLYFFPLKIKETSKSVTVQVSKYMLGYWYSKDFTVAPGETIGKVAGTNINPTTNERIIVPEEVDYSTDTVMVDAVLVNDWDWLAGRMKAMFYYDMLFSIDGEEIERIACEQVFWPKNLQEKYYEIKRLQNEPRIPLRPWSPQQLLPEDKVLFPEDTIKDTQDTAPGRFGSEKGRFK
ncbi:MAG: hypothetical protein ACYSSI_04330 [Planctomycetota bacterium]|jgi:hypothetical protein